MSRIDDRRLFSRPSFCRLADKEMSNRADRVLRRGEADAQQPVAAERAKAFERQGEVGAALVRRDRVDFVDDHRARMRQHLAPGLGAKQDVERFRRRHQDMRRTAAHPLAFGGGRVARAHPGADLDIGQAGLPQLFPDAGQRRLEVAMNVVRQGLEGRDIDHLGRVGQTSFETLPDQIIDRRKECGERLARAGRGRDQRMAARFDCGPGLGLGSGRRRECLGEPCRHRRMEQLFEASRGSRRVQTRVGRARPDRPAAGRALHGQRRGGVSQC